MAGAPSPARQLRMLELLRSQGLVLAGPDQPVLRYLEFRRHARALPLHDIRGKTIMARAWQITDGGIAAALSLSAPKRRKRSSAPQALQIDLEEAIAARSGERPVSLPLTDPDAPTVTAASVSAPMAAQSRRRARGQAGDAAHD